MKSDPSPFYVAEICNRLNMPPDRVEWLCDAIRHQGFELTNNIDQDTMNLHPWIPVVEMMQAEGL